MTSGRCEDNFDTQQSLNIHVKTFLFCAIDEMSGCLKPKLGQKLSGLWPHKTGACLIEVHLHVKSIGGGMKVLA